ncbi:phage tail protein [Paenibacillus cymbidii]|uniref:phage tail protein n=1 Tax=Paenibacillus cymbidii TaxID=1639034 RepID=UPI001081E4C8|nr:hypothetical protein [Paenibacillus cymbidii]
MIIIAVVKNLMTRAGFDASGMRRGVRQAQQELNNFKAGVSRTLKGIVAATAAIGIGAAIKDSVKSAMDVEAAMGQIERTLGANAKSFKDWANESAIAFNMSRSDALKFGAVYSNLVSGFAKDTATTAKYTTDLLKASAVVASATGRTMEDTMERIRSGLLGNTEAIEDLGINVNVSMIESTNAFKKFANGKSWQQLDFQTQQQIRLFGILEQATTKYGDAVANNTNSKQQQFVAQLKNAQLALGQAFLPIYNIILPALTKMASALATAMNAVAQFTQALFGSNKAQKQTAAITSQASAVNDLGDAYNAAGKAAEGSVAGFDEVNNLNDSSDGGSGGVASMATDPTADKSALSDIGNETENVSAKVQAMAAKVKEAYGEISAFIKEHSDIIIAALGGVAIALGAVFAVNNFGTILGGLKGIAAAVGAILSPIGLVVVAIAALSAAFIYFYRTNETFRETVNSILQKIGEVATWLWQNVMVPFGKWLAEVMPIAWKAVTTAAEWLWKNVLSPFGSWLASAFVASWDVASSAAQWLWKNVLVPLGNFLLWFWQNVTVPLATVLGEVLGVAFQFVADIAVAFWENVLVPLGAFIAEVFGPAVEALSAVFSFLWEYVLAPLAAFIGDVLKVVFEALTKTIVFLWNNVLEPLVKFVGGALLTTFTQVFEIIGGVIDGLKTTLIGIMTFITGVFTGDWQKAWDGVKDIFRGVFDSLYAIVKTPLNLIIDSINAVISGLNQIHFDIPDWVPGLGGKGFGISIPSIPRLAQGGITTGPMVAMIGDNPGGEEVVSPLDGLLDMIQSAVGTAIMAASDLMNSNQTSQQGDIVIQVDGTTLARVLNPFTTKENGRIGSAMITTT